MQRPLRKSLVALLGMLVILLGTGMPMASAHAAATGKPCWERIIDDWLDNGTIDGTYTPACYQAALRNVPEDLRDYSNITAAISVALQDALRHGGSSGDGRGGAAGTASEQPSGDLGTGGDSTIKPGLSGRTLQNAPRRSIYRRAVDKLGTTSAESLPIPLVVLAGLGAALLVAAIVLAAHKRLAARPGHRTTRGRSP